MAIIEKILEKKQEIESQYKKKLSYLEKQYREKRKEIELQYQEKITNLGFKIKELDSRYHRRFRQIRNFLTWPFILGMIIPLVILDFFIEIYHRICFLLYGLPYVTRKNYVRIDRHKLRYLTTFDKIWCVYCGYANGLIHYAFVIAGETEKYWCAIKHKKYGGFVEPPHHKDFPEYGDEHAYKEYLQRQNKRQ